LAVLTFFVRLATFLATFFPARAAFLTRLAAFLPRRFTPAFFAFFAFFMDLPCRFSGTRRHSHATTTKSPRQPFLEATGSVCSRVRE
jgi:hypothetical protein